MATFKFGRTVDIHWNGYEIVGPAETVFSIPDQLYEEFDADISAVEPTLTWIDTNEFQTLKNSVPTGGYVASVVGTSPVAISTTSNTATISLNSGTAGNGYLLVADGSGGTIWNPASTSGLTSVVGVSPISSVVSGGTVSVSLTANYQTAGNYASSASGTSPISATLSTAGVLSVSIDSSLTSAASASRTRSLVRNSTVSTIAKGSFVYVDGSNGTTPTIQNALANADATSARTFGIVEADIASNADGYVTNQGLFTGVDTSTFADGSVLWLSPTIAGAATTVKPTGPNHGVLLGIVVKGGSVGAGSIYIFIKNGAELDEIHDVNISGLANGDTLIWSSTASVWQNQTLANAGIAASTHTHPYQAAGTYVNAVTGTSPVSISTTAGTASVSIAAGSINSTHLSASSVGASQIIDASIGSAELADNAVVAAKINAAAVDTSKINSGVAAANTVLTANGTGGATFGALSISSVVYSSFSGAGTWTKPANCKIVYVEIIGGGQGGGGGGRAGTGVACTGGLGGRGGLYGILQIDAATLGSTVSVTVGAGGAGGAGSSSTNGASNGSHGGVSAFGSYQIRSTSALASLPTDYNASVIPQIVSLQSYDGTSISSNAPGEGNSAAGYKGDIGGGGGGGGGSYSTSDVITASSAGGSRYLIPLGAMLDSTTTGNKYPTGGGGAAGTSGTPSPAAPAAGTGYGGGGAYPATTAQTGGAGATPGGGGGGGNARRAASGSGGTGGAGAAGQVQVWAICS